MFSQNAQTAWTSLKFHFFSHSVPTRFRLGSTRFSMGFRMFRVDKLIRATDGPLPRVLLGFFRGMGEPFDFQRTFVLALWRFCGPTRSCIEALRVRM